MPDSPPRELRYHPDHGWARIDGGGATCGITAFAAEELGEVLFVELPAVGSAVTTGRPYGEIESAKAVSDLIAPLTGTVTAVNDSLNDTPQAINEDPYGAGWIVQIRLGDDERASALLSADEYVSTTEE